MRTARHLTPPPAGELAVTIGPLRRRHLRGVLAIESQVYPRPWTFGLYLSELSARDRVYLVARAGGRVVGYAGMMLVAGEGHLTTLAVDPVWHRRQIATRLMIGLVRSAVSEGCSSMTLEVRVSNGPAQELYRRFGFAPVGVRRNYYAEINEDALIMWAYEVDSADHAERVRAIEDGLRGSTVVDGVAW